MKSKSQAVWCLRCGRVYDENELLTDGSVSEHAFCPWLCGGRRLDMRSATFAPWEQRQPSDHDLALKEIARMQWESGRSNVKVGS
jgi:hypothetical protein